MYIGQRPLKMFLGRILCEFIGHSYNKLAYDKLYDLLSHVSYSGYIDCNRCRDMISVPDE